jgi:hypothetical protein
MEREVVERTNERLYESKLSREMLKGSFSLRRLLWLEEAIEVLDLVCQKLGFSWVGEG